MYSKIELVQHAREITHPAAREALKFMKMNRGIEIHHDGDMPARSGIGSSSAFTVGLLHALHGLKGRMPSKKQLALEAIHVEQDLIKETVGSQDQILAAYGGFNHITFQRDGQFFVKPMILAPRRLREFGSHLMLFYTGIVRTASDIATSFVNNIHDRKQDLTKMHSLVDEGISILTGRGDIAQFGKLMHKGWQLKRGLSSKISNPMVENLYEAALSAGALGGKLTGAGGGGFLLLFVPPAKHAAVREKLDKLIHVRFQFDFSGSQIIFHDAERGYLTEERQRARQTVDGFRELGVHC